jgi:hypothetical protein
MGGLIREVSKNKRWALAGGRRATTRADWGKRKNTRVRHGAGDRDRCYER